MPRTTLEGWLCYRCEHKWVPRDDETPRVCPKCKSPYWDIPRGKKSGGGKFRIKPTDAKLPKSKTVIR